jgi:hypothetical protein
MTRAGLAAVLVAALAGCFSTRGGGESRHCPEGQVVDLGLQEDVVKFAGCKKAGGILIRTGATVDVTPLADLEEISGDLVVGPTVGVDTIAFNGLLRVGGTIRIANNGSLRGLFLPRLEQAGRVEVDNNAVLSTISVPRLATVQGAMVITDNNALELVSASMLSTIGQELVIAGQPKLVLLEMQRIAHMATIRLEANPKLPPEVVEHLRGAAATP